ncbi:MAG: TetR/AcrR family transcriptional regulator [Polyangiales bacterium]
MSEDGERRGAELGLRARKAAATRGALARALDARLAEEDLGDIKVDDLAAAAGVSRMTFFNHFATKEQALEHVFVRMLFEHEALAARRGMRGRAAIESLFDAMGRRVQESPARARRTLAHFSTRPLDREVAQLTPAERALLAPGLDVPGSPSLGALLMRLVAEARAAGEIAVESTDYELGHMLGALFMGAALVGHSAPKQNWLALYRHHLARALGPSTDAPPQRRAKNGRGR